MSVIIKWLAHSGFQIRVDGKIVYVDLEKYSEVSEKADLVLVTHSHTDHCDPEKIKKVLKDDTLIIAPKDCAPTLGGRIKTLKAGEETSIGNIRIKAVEAYNYKRFRTPGNPFHPRGFGVGYLVTAGGRTIYHAGDSDFVAEMKQLGPVDVALLPSGSTYTMDNAEAAEAAIAINARVVMPMHRWDTNPEGFKSIVEANSSIEVVILKEGQEYQIS